MNCWSHSCLQVFIGFRWILLVFIGDINLREGREVSQLFAGFQILSSD